MMVTKDMTMANDPQQRRIPGMGWPIAIFIGTVMLAGGLAGYGEARIEQGHTGPAPWAGALIAVALGAGAFALYVRRHIDWFRQWTPRKRLYWVSMIMAGALGMISAIMLQASGDGTGLMSDNPMTPQVAIGLSIFWIVGVIAAMLIYHRTVDDHERRAYHLGGLAGFYAFVFPCPVWWVLARADLAPPVEAMPLFALSLTVNAVVYFWFKFR